MAMTKTPVEIDDEALVTATAERERLTLLAADRDYEVVASVTGQPVRML